MCSNILQFIDIDMVKFINATSIVTQISQYYAYFMITLTLQNDVMTWKHHQWISLMWGWLPVAPFTNMV